MQTQVQVQAQMQPQPQPQELLFHCENSLDASTSKIRGEKRKKSDLCACAHIYICVEAVSTVQ